MKGKLFLEAGTRTCLLRSSVLELGGGGPV